MKRFFSDLKNYWRETMKFYKKNWLMLAIWYIISYAVGLYIGIKLTWSQEDKKELKEKIRTRIAGNK